MTDFVSKSLLSDDNTVATLALFWVFAGYLFFHPFTLNVFVSLILKYVS